MNRFVLKNTFIKIYIYHFSTNIFIKKTVKVMFRRPCRYLNAIYFLYGGSTDFVVNRSQRSTRSPVHVGLVGRARPSLSPSLF